MILTAGPSITQKEIDYVTDAITNGHDEHCVDYIKRFEHSFATYLGVRHALSTSSCTGALHLALVALDVKEGDEVIVPDLTWIATAAAVRYVGATPVFADVCKDTWCISPVDIENKITSRTRAIIPVHLYGQPCNMIEILRIAKKHNLRVVEDAAPSLGATYNFRKTGTFGDIGCFSFQGAKILSTGEGGMLVTNNDQLYDRVCHFAEHGRSGNGFDISDIGFKYKMSNLQAAWGLAQLERIDELIVKRAQIFEWYYARLHDVCGLQLNKLPTYVEAPIYWMTSIVLDETFSVSRDKLMLSLKEKGVDTRPFFPPMSTFRMFTDAGNSTAKYLSTNGVNLPSGHKRTEEDVEYICNVIKDIIWDYE